MKVQDFTALYGFNPLDLPDITVNQQDGDERDAVIIATRQSKLVSVTADDDVLAGWKYVNIVHRCYTPMAVTL